MRYPIMKRYIKTYYESADYLPDTVVIEYDIPENEYQEGYVVIGRYKIYFDYYILDNTIYIENIHVPDPLDRVTFIEVLYDDIKNDIEMEGHDFDIVIDNQEAI